MRLLLTKASVKSRTKLEKPQCASFSGKERKQSCCMAWYIQEKIIHHAQFQSANNNDTAARHI